MAANGQHIVNPSSRPLIPGIYAPVPSFFLPQSEDLGMPSSYLEILPSAVVDLLL